MTLAGEELTTVISIAPNASMALSARQIIKKEIGWRARNSNQASNINYMTILSQSNFTFGRAGGMRTLEIRILGPFAVSIGPTAASVALAQGAIPFGYARPVR